MKPLFEDRVCGVVAAATAREMREQLRSALARTRTVELRLDWLRDERELVEFFSWLVRHLPRAVLIATCRRRAAGGKYRGDIATQLAVLRLAVACGCRWADVEVDTAERFPGGTLGRLLGGAGTIISFHDFRRTPSPARLHAIARRLRPCGGTAIKVATQCRSLADALRVLALCKGRRDVVAVPMGEAALAARVLALRQASQLAYAAVGEATAPGQLSLAEMTSLYPAASLNARTRVYGVIGNPVGHSLSPVMHNAAFRARGVNAVYLPFEVRDLRDFLGAIEPLGIAGFSVTLPHKEAILHHLDDCDPLAARIGAVNTVVVSGRGKLYGCNTDYVGVLRALGSRLALRGSRVLVLGAGGAARAVAFALAQGGAVVCVASRRKARAKELARAVRGEVAEPARLAREYFDGIVNCTPLGMYPWVKDSPLAARQLNARVVFDLIYRPLKTRLLQVAERRGIETISGVEMFVAQGAAQWEIWNGMRAPEGLMRRAVVEALRGEGSKEVRK
jgi:3-dehydroquinate dehydratase/shikimate dehydrogenase